MLTKPVDVVIAWVDGSDPKHQSKRNDYLKAGKKKTTIATKARRFSDNGEILICLRSLATHLPWINRVFIVTDNQVPSCLCKGSNYLPQSFLNKIQIVDHREIYAGYEQLLPTFNSLSIETFIWRTPELSEHFIYLNDDMFFCGPVVPENFFKEGQITLRGQWTEWDDNKMLSFHGENNKRGAALTTWQNNKFFRAAHVAHPMKKSVLKKAFATNPALFEKNASWRFRSRKQFWPISLHNHLAFEQNLAVQTQGEKDWVHFSVAFCRDASQTQLQQKLDALKAKSKKLACLNFAEAVLEKNPDAMAQVERVIQPSFSQKMINKLNFFKDQ